MSWGSLRASGSYSDNTGAIGPHVYITLSGTPQVGDTLLVGVVCDNTGASTPTVADIHDSNNRTVFSDFTLLGSYTANPTTSGGATVGYLYGAIVDQTWSNTGIYVDLSETVNAKGGCAFVYSGAGSLTPRRTVTTGNGDNPTAASQGQGAIGDLLIYLAGQESNAAPTLTPGGSPGSLNPQSTWTSGGGASANIAMFMGTRVDTVGVEVSISASTVSDGGVIAIGLKPDPDYAQPVEATQLGWVNGTSTPTTASITLRPNALVVVSAIAVNGTQSATASISSTHSPSLSWSSIDVGFRGTYLFYALTGSNPGAGTITLTGGSADWMIHALQFENIRASSTVEGYAETAMTGATSSLLHSLTVTPELTDCKYEICYLEGVTSAPTAGSGAYQLPLSNAGGVSGDQWLTTGYKQDETNANIFLQWPDPSTYAGLAGFVVRGYGTAPSTTPVSASRATSWRVLKAESASRATQWAVNESLTPVQASRATDWRVLQAVQASRATSWAVAATVTAERATAWAVRFAVSTERNTAWTTSQAVQAARQTFWTASFAVEASRATTWSVEALLGAPTLTGVAMSQTQIDLSWTSVPTATGYDIERDAAIIVYDHATLAYSDTVGVGTTHAYRVRAVVAS